MAMVQFSSVSDVAPDATPPQDYQSIKSSPADFGGAIATGTQEVGAGLSKAAHFFGEVAADDATNKFQDGATKILHGDPNKMVPGPDGQMQPDTGFFGLRGQDAMNARPGVEKQIDDLMGQTRGNLYTPEQQLEFDRNSRRLRSFMAEKIGSHADAQTNTWYGEVNEASASSALDHIARNADDPEEVKHGTADLIRARIRQAQLKGGGDPLITQAWQTARQQAAEMQIHALIPTNPAAAQQVFDSERNLLASSSNYDSLSARLQTIGDKALADNITRSIVSGVMPAPATRPSSAGSNPDNLGNVKTASGAASGAAEFVRPASTVDGVMLAANTLRSGYQGMTLAQLGAKWAPPSENKTSDWVANVSADSGISPDTVPDLNDPGQLKNLLHGIAVAEKSPADRARFTDDVMMQGVQASIAGRSAAIARAIPAAQQMPPGFPTREDWISRIPEGLSDQQYGRVYAGVSKAYSHLVQATTAERSDTEQRYKGGLAMLADGRDFSYDRAQIKRLFPEATATEMLDNLDDARTVGQQIVSVRGMSPTDISAQLQSNQTTLANSTGQDYARRRKLAQSFETAADQHFKQLLADPAAYVGQSNPEVERARQAMTAETPQQAAISAGSGIPTAAESYGAKMLAEQDRLGVPAMKQHVLNEQHSQALTAQIMGDPEKAPATIQALQQQWGSAWPSVFRDLVTVGKLPAAYQSVAVLDNQRDGALLARALSEQAKSGKTWDDILPNGAKDVGTIKTNIRGNPAVVNLINSLSKSGSSAAQVDGVLGSIDTLAYAKSFYDRDPAAAQNAADSFTSKYEFMPNGGARVPTKQFDAVSANSRATLDGLSTEHIAVPELYGKPGQPSADEYTALIKASPTWITSPKADALWLIDNGGRLVRGKDGVPLSVPFNAPSPATPSIPETAAPTTGTFY